MGARIIKKTATSIISNFRVQKRETLFGTGRRGESRPRKSGQLAARPTTTRKNKKLFLGRYNVHFSPIAFFLALYFNATAERGGSSHKQWGDRPCVVSCFCFASFFFPETFKNSI